GALPASFTGIVFSNEFFDALPVDVAVYDGRAFREQLVDFRDDAFAWRLGGPVGPELDEYLRLYFPPPEPGRWYEANLEALACIPRLSSSGWGKLSAFCFKSTISSPRFAVFRAMGGFFGGDKPGRKCPKK